MGTPIEKLAGERRNTMSGKVQFEIEELAEDAGGHNRWRVTFGDGEPHAVVHLDSGQVVCDCRGFTFRGRCRHVEAVQAQLGGGQ